MDEYRKKLELSAVNSEKNTSGSEENELERITVQAGETDGDFQSNISTLNIVHASAEGKPVLKEPTVDAVVEYIRSGNCKNIVTLAGAGISTSAGIPDFRSPGSGLYSNLMELGVPNPEAVFSIEYFKINPKPFFSLTKELYPADLKPTLCHYFIRLLHEKNLLLRHYTQNVDTLEHMAGIPAEKIVEAHGTFRTAHCMKCSTEYTQQWMKETISCSPVPKCESCNGVVKPDVVLFGESLPDNFYDRYEADFDKCDLLIIMGTSLTVNPFASLVCRVKDSCPRLLINKVKMESDEFPGLTAFKVTPEGLSFAIGSPGNKRDVGFYGDCDDRCSTLAQKLGWKEELDALKLTNEGNTL